MERIVLDSHLDCNVILEAIFEISSGTIRGYKRFEGAESYLGIEALAQLGAYHVRYLCDFEKHAFLLGIKRCALSTEKRMNGPFRLAGELLGHGGSAFSYHLLASCAGVAAIEGEFLFGTVEYDETHFKKDVLREYFRKVFSRLRNASAALERT